MLRNTLRLRASSEGRTNLVVGLLSKVRIHISGEVWLQPTRWQRSLKGGPDRSWSRVARQAENAPLGYSGISLACRLQRTPSMGHQLSGRVMHSLECTGLDQEHHGRHRHGAGCLRLVCTGSWGICLPAGWHESWGMWCLLQEVQ